MKIRLTAVAILFGLAAPAAAVRVNSYSGYSTAVQGPLRTVGLGGAVVAAPDTYASTLINPAGLSLTPVEADFDVLAENHVQDLVVDPDRPTLRRKLDRSLTYLYNGFSHRIGSAWGVGFVYATPFRINRDFTRRVSGFDEAHHAEIDVNALSVGVGRDLVPGRLAVGLTVEALLFREAYQFMTGNPAGSPANKIGQPAIPDGFERTVRDLVLGVRGGVIWRAAPWVQVGAAFSPAATGRFDPLVNDASLPQGVTWFRDVLVPARAAVGAAFIFSPRMRAHVESDYVRRTRDTVLVGEGFFGVFKGISEGQFDVVDGRWGMEYFLFNHRNLKTWLRGGGYYETVRTEGAFKRYHSTMGADVHPGVLQFSVAYDVADFYRNFGFGIGVYVDRVLGWFGVKM